MYYYAQINEDYICIGVSSFETEVESENLIPLETLDFDLLKKKYMDGEWVVDPDAIPEEESESLEQIAKEIQIKQAIDTLIKFDALATVFENHETTTLNTYDVLAVLLDQVMELSAKVDSLTTP